MEDETITVETVVAAPPDEAWAAYTDPSAITQWNFASDDWCCPRADVDLRPGGRHVARMEARDGTMGFDFGGTYEAVDPARTLTLRLDDGRSSRTSFEPVAGGTLVRTVFEAEPSQPRAMQRDGWQAILDNYARHVERRHQRS